MAMIKISSKVEEGLWDELREVASESHQNISGLLSEAIGEYLQRRRVRPVVLEHLEGSIQGNALLGQQLDQ